VKRCHPTFPLSNAPLVLAKVPPERRGPRSGFLDGVDLLCDAATWSGLVDGAARDGRRLHITEAGAMIDLDDEKTAYDEHCWRADRERASRNFTFSAGRIQGHPPRHRAPRLSGKDRCAEMRQKRFWLMDVAFHVSLGWEYHGPAAGFPRKTRA
jgi:hypothetical protein